MGHSNSGYLTWLVVAVGLIVIALLFHRVRVWLWGTWLVWKGYALGRRASHYSDVRRVGQEVDRNYHNIKGHFLEWSVNDIKGWTSGPQKRLLKRLGTLRRNEVEVAAQQAKLEKDLIEEQQNPPRERPRIKGLGYILIASLLMFADIAITYMCLQTLNYPPLFLFPSAIMLGVIGFFAGDFLGKNIEPAQKNPNPDKNRMAIVLLGAFSVFYCVVFGTMRFIYTQRDPSVPLALNIFGSYGFITIIVGCSVMLGWLHEGETVAEALARVKRRRARIDVSIDRCLKHGAKMTEAFRAHLSARDSESGLVRSRFRGGFDSSWSGRAPYGVESPNSPLEFDEEMLKGLTWPDPPTGIVTMKPGPKLFEDLARYDEPPQPVPAPRVAASPQPAVTRPPQPAPRLTPAPQDGPPPIG